MHSREKYLHKISYLIENNTTDPIQILNNLYQTDFNNAKKRKHTSLFKPAHTLNSLELIFLKFSEALTVQNKSTMIEALCAFITFFPHLSLHVPTELKNDIKPYALPSIIKNKLSDFYLKQLAIKGKIKDLQDLISQSPDKGESLIKLLCDNISVCFVTIKRCHETLSGCVTSLGNLGYVISNLPMSIQVKVLKLLFEAMYIVPSASTALLKLIPQLYLPEEINKISRKIQKTFKKNKGDYWIISSKVLNIIDLHYLIDAKSRHNIIEFLLSNLESKPLAYVALASLSHSIGLEKDGGLQVITILRQILKSDSYIKRANAVRTLNKLTDIIAKIPESSSVLLEFAQYIVTIPAYYKNSNWPTELRLWDVVIANQLDHGAAFFKMLIDAVVLNIHENSSIILDHIIFWKHLLKKLPDKGYSFILAYRKALEQEKEKFRFDPAHSPMVMHLLINQTKHIKDILVNFPNEILLILENFVFFWQVGTTSRGAILINIDEISNLVPLSTQAKLILKPIEHELKDYQAYNSKQCHLSLSENKKQCLANNSSDPLVSIYFKFAHQYSLQFSWVWTVLDFFQTCIAEDNIAGVAQAIGKFYNLSSQQALLFNHVPIKDVTNIIQEYTYTLT